VEVTDLLSERRITASLLILSCAAFLVVGYLFTARVIWNRPGAQTELHLRWERGVAIAAFLINVLGFVLLETLLQNAGAVVIARLGLAMYLVSACVLVVAETTYLHNRDWVYPQLVVHVVLAFLAQAAFGVALLRTGLVAPWAGWATIIWNLTLLAIMSIAYSHNIYFPWLHYVAPLLIGIALLAR
jgi:hypothetical protein